MPFSKFTQMDGADYEDQVCGKPRKLRYSEKTAYEARTRTHTNRRQRRLSDASESDSEDVTQDEDADDELECVAFDEIVDEWTSLERRQDDFVYERGFQKSKAHEERKCGPAFGYWQGRALWESKLNANNDWHGEKWDTMRGNLAFWISTSRRKLDVATAAS